MNTQVTLMRYSLKKTILILGLIFFIIHLFYSWVYFKERMLNEDGSYYILELIQSGRFVCEHYRYSAYLFYWIPLLALKVGASVEEITRIYSVAIDGFYFFLFLFSFLILKNIKGAVMVLFFLCIFLGRDYFLPIGEYQSSVITSLALCGLSFGDFIQINKGKILWAIILILITLNFHSIGLLSIAYIISFEFLESEKKYRKYWFIIGVASILIFIIKSSLLPFDPYEHDKMERCKDMIHYILHPLRLSSVYGTFRYFFVFFPEAIVIFFASMILLVSRKRWLTFCLSLLYSYFVLILFSTLRGDTDHIFWNAEYFILLGVPALLPLTNYLFALNNNKIVFPVIIISFTVIFILRTETNLGYFQNKIKYAERLIYNGSQLPEKRYIADYKNIPMYISNSWPLPFQTLILSSFKSPTNAVSYTFAKDINIYDSIIQNKSFFLGPDWSMGMFREGINKKNYFHLPANGYRKLTTSQQNFAADSGSFNSATVTISIVNNRAVKINDSISAIYIHIVNNAGKIIPSIPDSKHPTQLSYHLFDTAGKCVLFDNMRTTLETDIYRQSQQALYIKTNALKEKKLELQIDFVTEGVRWWGINTTASIEVK